MLKAVIPTNLPAISEGLDFVEASLKKYDFKSKDIHEAMLLFEECMVHLVEHAPADGTVHIHIKKHGGLASISISAPGPELQQDSFEFDLGVEAEAIDRSHEAAIRGILLKAYEDKIHYVRKGKYNFMTITVGNPERMLAMHTVQAIVVAAILGFFLRFGLSAHAAEVVENYVFLPITTLFVNFLMLITAPAVFFSLTSSIARSASFSDPGKVSLKVFAGYTITSILAVLIGLGVFNLISPGTPGELSGYVEHTGVVASTDFLQTVTEIIPTNIIAPFLNNNTLQLIFIAAICGIALGRLGDYSPSLRMFIEAMDTLFNKIVEIVSKCVPVATLAATASCIMTVDGHVLLSILGMILTLLLGLACIGLVYIFIVLFIGRVNPFMFFRKCTQICREALLAGNAVSAIPKTIRSCKNSLGISKKVSAFSIPFGAVANVDGNCIYLAVAGLFLARICGVDLLGSTLITIMFTVFMLSLGAPIAPGTVNICLTVLLSQMGVSMAAMSLIIGINSIAEMLLLGSNVVGDVAVTLAVANSEGLLNKDVFNTPPRK